MIENNYSKWGVKGQIVALLGLFIFAIIWRLYGLDNESLFMDEIRQVGYYKESFFNMLEFSSEQQQPPLDYWIGNLVFRIDDSDFMARLPAAVFGAIAAALLALLLSNHINSSLAYTAAVIFAVLPFNLYFSQEARPYAISSCLFLLYFWLLSYLYQQKHLKLTQLGAMTLVSILFLLSRTLAPAVVVVSSIGFFTLHALLSILLSTFKRQTIDVHESKKLYQIILALLMAGLIYLPIFLQIVSSGKRYAQTGANIDWHLLYNGIESFRLMPLWEAYITQTEPLGWVIAMLVPILFLVILFNRKVNQAILWLSLFLLFTSLFLHAFIFFAKTDYHFRPPYPIYLLPLVVIVTFLIIDQSSKLLLARAKTFHQSQKYSRIIMALILVASSIYVLPRSVNVHQTITKTDWKALSQLVKDNYSEGHLLLFKSIQGDERWKLGMYGAHRYSDNFTGVAWMIINILEQRLSSMKSLSTKPVLIFFQYRDYYISEKSDYPIMKASFDSEHFDFSRLQKVENIDTTIMNGLTVIKLKNSTGNFALDTLILFNQVLKELPRDKILLDMYRVFAKSLAMCGDNNYIAVNNLIKQLDDSAENIEKLKTIDSIYANAESKNYHCFK